MKVTCTDFADHDDLKKFVKDKDIKKIISIETLIYENDKHWNETQERWVNGLTLFRVWWVLQDE